MLSERALARRLKRHLLKAEQQFFAPCAPGFEAELAAELQALPQLRLIELERGGVAFGGPLELMYHANLQLRSAHRVLLRLDAFLAQSYPMLFDRARRVPWEHYVGFQPHYRLKVSAKRSRLRHQAQLAATLQAAIARRLAPLGLEASPSEAAPLEFRLRLHQDRATLSLNTSGTHLHKRGYKQHVTAAPLRETLAASLLLTLPLARYDLIVDPLCGSGTLLCEAWQILAQHPPGAQRPFAFEALPFFQPRKWARLKREALAAVKTPQAQLVGLDISAAALAAASANARALGAPIDLGQADALSLTPAALPPAQRPLLVANLPYGERLLNRQAAIAFCRRFTAQLARHFAGWHVAFIAPAPDCLEGCAVHMQRAFENGGLRVWWLVGEVAA